MTLEDVAKGRGFRSLTNNQGFNCMISAHRWAWPDPAWPQWRKLKLCTIGQMFLSVSFPAPAIAASASPLGKYSLTSFKTRVHFSVSSMLCLLCTSSSCCPAPICTLSDILIQLILPLDSFLQPQLLTFVVNVKPPQLSLVTSLIWQMCRAFCKIVKIEITKIWLLAPVHSLVTAEPKLYPFRCEQELLLGLLDRVWFCKKNCEWHVHSPS